MKTQFEIQTESGQLWPDIQAHLLAQDAIIAEHEAQQREQRAEIASLQASLTEHQALSQAVQTRSRPLVEALAGEIQKIGAAGGNVAGAVEQLGLLVALATEVATPVVERKKAEIAKQIEALQAEQDALA